MGRLDISGLVTLFFGFCFDRMVMQKVIFFSVVALLFVSSFSGARCRGQDNLVSPEKEGANLASAFEKKVRPLLERYCFDCHAPGEMEDLDFLAAETVADVADHRDLFAGVAEQLENRAMPPKKSKQPTEGERKLIVDWLKKTLDLKPGDNEGIAPYVVEVYQDRKGNLWLGTVSKGAARYDGKTLTWFSEKDGLPSNTVTSFAEDGNGNLWLGTHCGVCKYDGKRFAVMWRTTGQHDQGEGWMGVRSDKNGNIWTSTNKGVFRFDGTSFSEFKLPIDKEEIASFSITAGKASLALEDRRGNLWFKTDGFGAIKYDGKSFTRLTKKDGLWSNNVTSILEDKQGNVWFTCIQSYQPKMTGDGGVCRYDGKSIRKFPEIKGLNENDIYTIYETRAGDIWIGASGVGAYRYDGKEFALYRETDRKYAVRKFGIQSILEARDGTIWFGFSGGLFRFNGESFFNVSEDGPWEGLAVAMAKVVVGEKADSRIFHTNAREALAAMAGGKFDLAKKILLKLKKEEPNEMTVQERSITMLGYRLMSMNRLDLAIEVFKINTELHPEHFNTWDSLGEAYWRKGNERLALRNYEKSLELNPGSTTGKNAIRQIQARQKYEKVLVAPKGWMEEVIVIPPSFAPTMSFTGMEHLRLPPEFRNPESEWFLSYLFAIELTEPSELTEKSIGDQLLLYFRGLASGGTDKEGKLIKTDKFSIEPQESRGERTDGEFVYLLTWQEPFAGGTPLKQNIRVKVILEKNKHGIVFICGSPAPFDSEVWKALLEIRTSFESTSFPGKSNSPSNLEQAGDSARQSSD